MQGPNRLAAMPNLAAFPGAAQMYFVYYICTEKLRLPRWSCQNVLRILHCTTLTCTAKLLLSRRICQSVLHVLLNSFDFLAGAAKMYFVYYTCTEKLRLSSRRCQNVLCTTLALKSCDFRATAAKALQADAEEENRY